VNVWLVFDTVFIVIFFSFLSITVWRIKIFDALHSGDCNITFRC